MAKKKQPGLLDVLSGRQKIGVGSSGKMNFNWKIKSRVFDSDRDGVPDWKDCQPFDRSRHVRDPGDWMETEDPRPVLDFGREWMTQRYKRRPKKEHIVKKPPTAARLAIEALGRYEVIGKHPSTMDDAEAIRGDLEEWADNQVDAKKFNWYQPGQDVIVLYDGSKRVYSFFVYRKGFYPTWIFSISKESRKKYGERLVESIVRTRRKKVRFE